MGRTPESLGRIGFSQRHHGRVPFGAVIGVIWIVGLFGLEGDRISSLQAPLLVVGSLLIYGAIVAVRRGLAARRDRLVAPPLEAPPTCVRLRWFGEEESRRAHPSGQTSPKTVHLRLVSSNVALPAQPAGANARPDLGYIPLPKP